MKNDNIFHLVYFRDQLEDDVEKNEFHYGILNTDENTVQCLCCGGVLEEGDYAIVSEWPDMGNLDNILKHYKGECD